MYKKRKTDGWLFENISSIFSANGGSTGRLQSAQWCMSHVELYHSKLGTQQASFSQKYTLRRDLSCPGIVKLLLNRSSSLLVFSYSSSALCIWFPPPVLWQSCCSGHVGGQESSPPECQLTKRQTLLLPNVSVSVSVNNQLLPPAHSRMVLRETPHLPPASEIGNMQEHVTSILNDQGDVRI